MKELYNLDNECVTWLRSQGEKPSRELEALIVCRDESLQHIRRCCLAYTHARAKQIRPYRWHLGGVLPASIKNNLCRAIDFFNEYSSSLAEFQASIGENGVNLLLSTHPPKALYVQVRVLENYGEFETSDGNLVMLQVNSTHSLPRHDCEMLIRQGILEGGVNGVNLLLSTHPPKALYVQLSEGIGKAKATQDETFDGHAANLVKQSKTFEKDLQGRQAIASVADTAFTVDLSKVVMRSDPKQETEHVRKNVDEDRKSVQRAVCSNFGIGVLVTLLLLSIPGAEAGYIPSEDDRPINMKVHCEPSGSQPTNRDPIGYLISATAPPVYLILFLVLNKLGFALPALAPARPAESSAPESRQPLIVTPHQPPPPPVVAGAAGVGIPLPAPAAYPMLTSGGVHLHTPLRST